MSNRLGVNSILLNIFALIILGVCIWGVQYVWVIVIGIVAVVTSGVPS